MKDEPGAADFYYGEMIAYRAARFGERRPELHNHKGQQSDHAASR
jgi:hypothetical protein